MIPKKLAQRGFVIVFKNGRFANHSQRGTRNLADAFIFPSEKLAKQHRTYIDQDAHIASVTLKVEVYNLGI